MKKRLLGLIVCPFCRGSFRLASFRYEGSEVVDGSLKCKCSCYPVIGGVPRILPSSLWHDLVSSYPRFFERYGSRFPASSFGGSSASHVAAKRRTALGFGYEWKRFSKIYGVYEAQFLDWIAPLNQDFFGGRLVLDAGCGNGRHVYFSAKYGAEVVGVDLSGAVDVAYRNTRQFGSVHIVQADIYHLPFRMNTFDLGYSIGVLHHLPEPEEGFKRLVSVVKRGGLVHAWVYGKEGNSLLKLMDPVRKHVISRLPLGVARFIAFSVMLFLHPLIKFVYRPLNSFSLTRSFVERFPQNAFFYYLSKFSFEINYSILFDQFLAPVAYYYAKDEFASWFAGAGLRGVSIVWRNRNSWKGSGRKP
ncbi:methyltransferase domain-containing protein [Candidatus Woesearchaeota archaeon]|nr:methyltransferase domain-containing protein [Candidatus Woesearchaeota archaeon]